MRQLAEFEDEETGAAATYEGAASEDNENLRLALSAARRGLAALSSRPVAGRTPLGAPGAVANTASARAFEGGRRSASEDGAGRGFDGVAGVALGETGPVAPLTVRDARGRFLLAVLDEAAPSRAEAKAESKAPRPGRALAAGALARGGEIGGPLLGLPFLAPLGRRLAALLTAR